MKKYDFKFDDIQTKWIYLSGLGDHWRHVYEAVFDFVNTRKCKLAFVPGSFQLMEKGKEFMDILSIVDIIFINKEEAETIASNVQRLASSLEEKEIMQELTKAVQKLGPKMVVITDGINGSFVLDEKGNFYEHGTVPAKVVQKTGAGDGYASGFFGAILNGKTIKESMEWGTINGASVISKIGAQPGLLTKTEIEEKIQVLSSRA